MKSIKVSREEFIERVLEAEAIIVDGTLAYVNEDEEGTLYIADNEQANRVDILRPTDDDVELFEDGCYTYTRDGEPFTVKLLTTDNTYQEESKEYPDPGKECCTLETNYAVLGMRVCALLSSNYDWGCDELMEIGNYMEQLGLTYTDKDGYCSSVYAVEDLQNLADLLQDNPTKFVSRRIEDIDSAPDLIEPAAAALLMTLVGICPDCLSEYKHDYEEPFAHCDCGTGEWTEPYSLIQASRLERYKTKLAQTKQAVRKVAVSIYEEGKEIHNTHVIPSRPDKVRDPFRFLTCSCGNSDSLPWQASRFDFQSFRVIESHEGLSPDGMFYACENGVGPEHAVTVEIDEGTEE